MLGSLLLPLAAANGQTEGQGVMSRQGSIDSRHKHIAAIHYEWRFPLAIFRRAGRHASTPWLGYDTNRFAGDSEHSIEPRILPRPRSKRAGPNDGPAMSSKRRGFSGLLWSSLV